MALIVNVSHSMHLASYPAYFSLSPQQLNSWDINYGHQLGTSHRGHSGIHLRGRRYWPKRAMSETFGTD